MGRAASERSGAALPVSDVVRAKSFCTGFHFMTDDNTMTAEGGAGGQIISRIEAALTGMEALRATVERRVAELNAMSREELKAAGLDQLQRDLGRTVAVALIEEGKVADALRKERGGDGIDFAAARLAVGRQLDRLAERLAEG